MQPSEWVLGLVVECKLLQLECSIARHWHGEHSKRFVRLHLAYANVVEDSITKLAENRVAYRIWCRFSVCFRISGEINKAQYYNSMLTFI